MGNRGKNDLDIPNNMDIYDQPDGIHSEPVSPLSTKSSESQDARQVTQQSPDDSQSGDILGETVLKTHVIYWVRQY